MINYNEQAATIYAQNKAVGWWDDPNRCIYQTLQLVSTEIAEATEGERKDLMDDHIPTRKMGEVELADALIRVLDLAGRYGWEVDFLRAKHNAALDYVDSIAGKHLILNMSLCCLAQEFLNGGVQKDINYFYSGLIASLLRVAETQGYDIEAAMVEKLIYNKTRADHKRENRAKEGGKAF